MVRTTEILKQTAKKTIQSAHDALHLGKEPVGRAAITLAASVPSIPKKQKPYSPINNRSWRDLDPMYDRRIPGEKKFTVLSYNILNQAYVWPKVYDNYVDPAHREPQYRLNLLKKSLTHYQLKSDIMCFQEMESRGYREIWKPLFEGMGYGSEYVKKNKPHYWDRHVEENHFIDDESLDGISIFYNKEKFELLESYPFNITDQYFENLRKSHTKTVHGINLRYQELAVEMDKRNQVALVLVLKHLTTGRTIILCNTHLYWKNKAIQFIQTLTITEVLRQFRDKYNHFVTTLFMGDFNSGPESSVYELLKKKEVKLNKYNTMASFMAPNHQKFKVKSPIMSSDSLYDRLYKMQFFKKETRKVSELYTCITPEYSNALDHMFYNQRQLKLTRVLTGLKEPYIQKIKGLPNDEHPSDHIPIRAEFAVRENRG